VLAIEATVLPGARRERKPGARRERASGAGRGRVSQAPAADGVNARSAHPAATAKPSVGIRYSLDRQSTHSKNWMRALPKPSRKAGLVALAVVVIVVAVGAVVSWHFASEVLVPDHSAWPAETTVDGVATGRVALSRSEATSRPGVYGLDWPTGHAIVGPVLSSDAAAVTRQLCATSGYLVAGMKVVLDPDAYVGDPAQSLGLAYTNVLVPDELGPMPGWFVAGRTHTWAIVVHGINGNLEGDLRLVPALHRAGLPALSISYREDLGAPRSPDGLHHMGLTEWRDLAAAARYALAHGARRLVLLGTSMGGAIVAQFMERSPLAKDVAGVVFDAPALSWKAILSFNASEMGLPAFAALPVEWAIGARIDADWSSLDALQHPSAFHLPVLLFHGTEDKVVPIATSDEFAKELPGWVTYYRVPHAGHGEAWNVDPALYEQRLAAFLSRVAGVPEVAPPSREPCGPVARASGR
jgi:alpha-beta hydrolase superfamily lysophospholipase